MRQRNYLQARRFLAFTLVELLIVVIIIAVIAAIAIPRFINSSGRAQQASQNEAIRIMKDGVERFKNDTSWYPAQLSDLTVTSAPANGQDITGATHAITPSYWRGPYMDAIPAPPSGYVWSYTVSASTEVVITLIVPASATTGTTGHVTAGTTGTGTSTDGG